MRIRNLLLTAATILVAVSCSTARDGYVRSPHTRNVWIRPAGNASYWIKADRGALPSDSFFLAASKLTLDRGKRYFAIVEPINQSGEPLGIGSGGSYVGAGGGESYTTASPGGLSGEVTHFEPQRSRERSNFPAALGVSFRIELFDEVPTNLRRGTLVIDAERTLQRLQAVRGIL